MRRFKLCAVLVVVALMATTGLAMAGTLEDVERTHITEVLAETNWQIEGPQGAANQLDLNPSTLRGKIRKLGIEKGD